MDFGPLVHPKGRDDVAAQVAESQTQGARRAKSAGSGFKAPYSKAEQSPAVEPGPAKGACSEASMASWICFPKACSLATCRLLCGGPSEPPAGDCGKSFYPPTVLTDVKPGLLLPEGDTRAIKRNARKAQHSTIQFRRNKNLPLGVTHFANIPGCIRSYISERQA